MLIGVSRLECNLYTRLPIRSRRVQIVGNKISNVAYSVYNTFESCSTITSELNETTKEHAWLSLRDVLPWQASV